MFELWLSGRLKGLHILILKLEVVHYFLLKPTNSVSMNKHGGMALFWLCKRYFKLSKVSVASTGIGKEGSNVSMILFKSIFHNPALVV